ncbi:hypothetical protein [Streptomyces sp. NPDC053048]|uniref:hypothetical protein n=1 Tax=Streptomyces sp. NPDC053048 TaxID=3365694 RepID=UPI0037CF06E5
MTVTRTSVPAAAGAGPAPRILGLDLSLTSTGIALPGGTTYVIPTHRRDGDRRLLTIRDEIRRILISQQPHVAVIEDLPKHAMGAGITAHVHGIVKGELLDCDVPYALVAPATLKSYASDYGRATKERMAAAAYLAAGVSFSHDPGGDRCDAWWLRAAGLDHYGHAEVTLPAAQRARLAKVRWPELRPEAAR